MALEGANLEHTQFCDSSGSATPFDDTDPSLSNGGSVPPGDSDLPGAGAVSAVAEGAVVVDNQALEQTRSLSQRCSAEAIGELQE